MGRRLGPPWGAEAGGQIPKNGADVHINRTSYLLGVSPFKVGVYFRVPFLSKHPACQSVVVSAWRHGRLTSQVRCPSSGLRCKGQSSSAFTDWRPGLS